MKSQVHRIRCSHTNILPPPPPIPKYHPITVPLPPKPPHLQSPKPHITHRRKRKRKRKPNIAPKPWQPNKPSNGPRKPLLRHAHDGAEDAEAEG